MAATVPTVTVNDPWLSQVGSTINWDLDVACVVTALGCAFLIPAGFRTDGASSPRYAWSICSPFDCSMLAALIHDWLYRHGGYAILTTLDATGQPTDVRTTDRVFTKLDADNAFLEIMRRKGVPEERQIEAYAAVREFGQSSWSPTVRTELNPPPLP